MIGIDEARKRKAEANEVLCNAHRLKAPQKVIDDLNESVVFWEQLSVDREKFYDDYRVVMDTYRNGKARFNQS